MNGHRALHGVDHLYSVGGHGLYSYFLRPIYQCVKYSCLYPASVSLSTKLASVRGNKFALAWLYIVRTIYIHVIFTYNIFFARLYIVRIIYVYLYYFPCNTIHRQNNTYLPTILGHAYAIGTKVIGTNRNFGFPDNMHTK